MSSGSIAILLCTFNGAQFLSAQLASYEAQDFKDWRLIASDDGSSDTTVALLEDFQKKHGADRVDIRRGPQKGFVANFMSLICDPAIEGEYYALSDQDDVWHPQKLSRARQFLSNAPVDKPVVYCSRTQLIDEQGRDIGLSAYYRKPPHFRNALVQSLASGNTMVLNEKMRWLLMQVGADANAPAHDWLVYTTITAVGGKILYDSMPTVSYRMHSGNVIGSNVAAGARVVRARLLWQGRFRKWADMNVAVLERIEGLMTDENRATFELFRRSRKLSLLPRTYGLMRSGVYRQSLLGNMGLAVATLVGKI
ncbi:MAG TPA: glycosyltransferase family 2 protein [Xanthobacteraceae bacterium]|nr:glycosyltransferase family 2 protein [Xanthobacteraceae bacterium]